jgi:hypothetical protein
MMSGDLRSSDRLGGSLCRAVAEGALVLLALLYATGWLRSAAILALPRRAALTLAVMPLADPASAQVAGAGDATKPPRTPGAA